MLGKLIDALRIALNAAAQVPASGLAGCAPPMALLARIMCPVLACLLLTPLTASAMIASEREGSILIGDALNAALVDGRVQSKRGATEPHLADVLCALVREGQGGLRSRCDIRRFDTQDAWWESLQRRETQFAVVRSDQQYRVQTEELARARRNRSAARGSLRALFSLDELPIVVVASRDSGIDSLRDPKAMQATHFLFGSEQDQTTLREVAGVALPGELNFKHADNSDSVVDAICRQPGQPSLVWLIGGRANPALDALTDGRCDITFVELPRGTPETLTNQLPYLEKTTIPAQTWPTQRKPIATVSVATTVVTSDLTSESLMFAVMSTVFDNFYRLQSLYLPAVNLTPPDLATRQLSPRRDQSGNYAEGHRSAPLHDGAWSYYVQRAMVEKPYYAIVGSFRDLRNAKRLASLLATRYQQTFTRGLQVRFSTNRVFAVIAGDAVNGADARSRMTAIQKAVPEIKGTRPIEAGSATWSPDLLARGARVYIHVVDSVHAKSAVPVQKALEQAGWTVPGIERVGNRSPNNAQLRYFRPSEKLVVEGIRQSLRKLKLSPAPTYVRGYENATNIRPLHFELWFPKGQP